MYHSETRSLTQYIRKRVTKKLPTNQSLQIINEIGQAFVEMRKQEVAEVVESRVDDRPAKRLQTMDTVSNLAVAYPGAAFTDFTSTEMSSPSCKDNLIKQSDAKADVHALAQIAYQLLTGLRPRTNNGTLVEYQLDGKPIVQQGLNRWQRKALKKALTGDRSQRTSHIQSFLQELNRVSVEPSIQRIGLSLILILASIGGVFLWKSTDTYQIQATDRVLEISKSGNQSTSFARFETKAMPNFSSGGSTKSTGNMVIEKATQFDTDQQKYAVINERPLTFSTRKDSLLEKIAYIDEVAAAYQKILKIDPSNKTATQGLNQIEDKYVQSILSIWETGDKPLSIKLNDQRLSSAPDNRRLLSLRKELLKLPSERKLDTSAINTIQGLINTAEEHIKASHFILPAEKNAVETYKEVLRLDPQNEIALNGLNAMAMVFENAAREDLASGNLNESAMLVEQGLMISPQRPQLISLREAISTASATRQQQH